MRALKIAKNPHVSLFLNIAYAASNCIVGFFEYSWWFITVGVYYAVLSTARFLVLKRKRKANGDINTERLAKRITGILLVALSFCLIGINILSSIKERGTAFNEIIMIAVAAYTFTKITVAIIGMVKAKNTESPIIKILRNISLADACVSIYTMQRSMLVTFPGMKASEIQLLNILTGTVTWFIVLLLGINLIGGKYSDMAKSKIAKATEQIADAVTDGYKKIEKGVVDGYKKIEKGIVDGYTKIEDKFVDAYLTKDGETVEEAKERIKKSNKQ